MFILAKIRQPFKMYEYLKTKETGKTNGDVGVDEEASDYTRENLNSFNTTPGSFSQPRHPYWSYGHFIRPHESFLGPTKSPYAIVPSGNVPLHWVDALLPPQSTVLLCDPNEIGNRNPGTKDPASTLNSDNGYRRRTRSSSAISTASASNPGISLPEFSGPKKFMRYTCRTCCEKLPTLNSLTTHLKSHTRPCLTQNNNPMSSRSDCKPSQVMTSKYGRRRSVISARDAMNPMASRQRRGRSSCVDGADQSPKGSSDNSKV